MGSLSIDIETFSSVDLADCGVYRYAESQDFEILLFGYSINDSSVHVVDLACGGVLPHEVLGALLDDNVIKWAFNAQFERVCLSSWLHRTYPDRFNEYLMREGTQGFLKPDSWRCSRVLCAYMGLPASLKDAGAVLGVERQKLSNDGIEYFSSPCKPTKKNGYCKRYTPENRPAQWSAFKEYNARDVEVEIEIRDILMQRSRSQNKQLWKEYQLDQEINDRGVKIDLPFVESALNVAEKATKDLIAPMKKLTGLENPNSVVQLKNWLSAHGCQTDSTDKKAVAQLLKSEDISDEVKEVLRIRQRLAKSSLKKYQRMKDSVCADGRGRGMFQFYGGGRTGRWSGKLIQLQNLPQNHMPDLEAARQIFRDQDEMIDILYDGAALNTLSELLRTALIPTEGHKFIIADFSSIEARILAWLAGEKWRMEVFERNEDIYCASASKMFGVPVVKHGVNGELRQKGKITELGLGYNGSVNALISMGALDMGLKEDELQRLVDLWREANPNIVSLWWAIDRAARTAVSKKKNTGARGIRFTYEEYEDKGGVLYVRIPSGRQLAYVKPEISVNRFGSEEITYVGKNPQERLGTYGGKLVENIVQATARDLLAYAIEPLSSYPVVMHIHDEVVIEADKNTSVAEVVEKMRVTPKWAKGLMLNASGFESNFYRKD